MTRHGGTMMRYGLLVLAGGIAGGGELGGQGKGKPERFGPRGDSKEQEGVPRGKLHDMGTWKSKVFDGTERRWWVYVPAQYDGKTPACVMVFQDGQWYKDAKSDFRVPAVFDNLIHKGEMPVTIAVFLP